MQQGGLKLDDIPFLLSDCDSHVIDKAIADNDLPLCHSEAVALAELLSGVVKDGKPGTITRKDRMAGRELYGEAVPPGMLIICSAPWC